MLLTFSLSSRVLYNNKTALEITVPNIEIYLFLGLVTISRTGVPDEKNLPQ